MFLKGETPKWKNNDPVKGKIKGFFKLPPLWSLQHWGQYMLLCSLEIVCSHLVAMGPFIPLYDCSHFIFLQMNSVIAYLISTLEQLMVTNVTGINPC